MGQCLHRDREGAGRYCYYHSVDSRRLAGIRFYSCFLLVGAARVGEFPKQPAAHMLMALAKGFLLVRWPNARQNSSVMRQSDEGLSFGRSVTIFRRAESLGSGREGSIGRRWPRK